MPSPGASAPPRLSIEDSYLELLADTLEGVDLSARGQFLQRYFKIIAHLDLPEAQCLQLWDEALAQRRQLSEQIGRPLSLKTALMDVLARSGALRVPVLIEYEDLKRLQLSAVTDPLTGLYNRRLFSETFEKELNRARRYGHPRGDQFLQCAATTLQKTLRTSDSAFRIGGDEFALILPQTDSAQAIALSRRVGVVFADSLRGLELAIRVSMDHGVATFPQDGEHADQLIRIADERLYAQKHANHSMPAAPGPAEAAAPPAVEPAKPMPPAGPVSIETAHGLEPPTSTFREAASAAAAGIAGAPAKAVPEPPKTYAIQRKAERVSMSGTNAYAVLG